MKIEIKETKKISTKFYNRMLELKKKVPQVQDVHKVLEEIRSDRY